jgi:hypothetical protein
MLQTEFAFTLPKGYVDREGNLHREGIMRLASAADEIAPLQDPRVQRNSAYMSIILLARVITRLGSLPDVNPGVIERMFAADVAYLQDLYARINSGEDATLTVTCPHCAQAFALDPGTLYGDHPLGE